jgi:copper chaperone CopZ
LVAHVRIGGPLRPFADGYLADLVERGYALRHRTVRELFPARGVSTPRCLIDTRSYTPTRYLMVRVLTQDVCGKPRMPAYTPRGYTPTHHDKKDTMSQTTQQLTYSVPAMSCGHCRAAISAEVERVPGVGYVDVDLDAKRVTVTGDGIDEAAVRAAIDEAGYDIG